MKKNLKVLVTDDQGNLLDTFSAQDLADEAEMTLDEIDAEAMALEAHDVVLRGAKKFE